MRTDDRWVDFFDLTILKHLIVSMLLLLCVEALARLFFFVSHIIGAEYSSAFQLWVYLIPFLTYAVAIFLYLTIKLLVSLSPLWDQYRRTKSTASWTTYGTSRKEKQ